MNPPVDMWKRYREWLWHCDDLGMSVDVSRMAFDDELLNARQADVQSALAAMNALEAGEIANPSEKRRVGHYWLRAPHLAPDDDIRKQIEQTLVCVKRFAADVLDGRVAGPHGPFSNLLLIGIGGSALGPQLLADALGGLRQVENLSHTTPVTNRCHTGLSAHFFDNTDPDGFDRVFAALGDELARTLVLVVSKSGGTVETRNGLLEAAARFERAGLDFAKQAVAVTQEGSALHQRCRAEAWLADFPMWDWVGGRTSVTSAVGLLPAALMGIDVDALIDGARKMDEHTRTTDVRRNPASLLALMWHIAGNGRGERAMVVLPYKDRLLLFPRYLQQLVMESLGKQHDLDGRIVHQGLTVYGNKGSTDQHAFVQQLRDGRNDFFATLIGVRRDGPPDLLLVERDVSSGDYLLGFLLGTRDALTEADRPSITIMLDALGARSFGALIALYERAVGFYASMIHVNAYDQPGVEAGKRAAASVIDLQQQLIAHLRSHGGAAKTAEQLAAAIGRPESTETVHHILEHLSANPKRGVVGESASLPAGSPADVHYQMGE